jgi:pteridine reductase
VCYHIFVEIKGKTALITGAAKRVGRIIALHLAEKGAGIILHYNHSKKEAEATRDEIKKFGVDCHLAQADLADTKQILKMTQEIYKNGRAVDILVNSASLFYKTPLKDVQESDWDKLVDANLKGPFILSKEIGNRMAAGNGGKIINIADWSGIRPYKDYAPYCVSKGGLITLTKTLARDLAPKVTANAIAPGPVLKPERLPEEESQAVIKKTLLGRWGTPQDIANAVSFLVESDFINGIVLVVDGGRSIV